MSGWVVNQFSMAIPVRIRISLELVIKVILKINLKKTLLNLFKYPPFFWLLYQNIVLGYNDNEIEKTKEMRQNMEAEER